MSMKRIMIQEHAAWQKPILMVLTGSAFTEYSADVSRGDRFIVGSGSNVTESLGAIYTGSIITCIDSGSFDPGGRTPDFLIDTPSRGWKLYDLSQDKFLTFNPDHQTDSGWWLDPSTENLSESLGQLADEVAAISESLDDLWDEHQALSESVDTLSDVKMDKVPEASPGVLADFGADGQVKSSGVRTPWYDSSLGCIIMEFAVSAQLMFPNTYNPDPSDGSRDIVLQPEINWIWQSGENYYELSGSLFQIATCSFTKLAIIQQKYLQGNLSKVDIEQQQQISLELDTTYYWRAIPNNGTDSASAINIYSFTTVQSEIP